jgi:Cytochrome c554 and c-prime
MPRPARNRMFDAVKANDGCVSCHRDVAEQWQASLHQRADIEPAYRRSFALEPLPFCRACHAPEGDPMSDEPQPVANIGVACVTCHVTSDEGVLAALGSSSAKRPAPHGVVRSARFGTAAACASCHEFRFPGARGDSPSSFMQTTLSEHATSPASSRACADCHMPVLENGKRSHAFSTSRDHGFLSKSIRIEAARLDEGRVRLRLEPLDPGHAFPTGDLFRRLELSAEISGPDNMSLGAASRYLTRHWGFKPKANGRELISDDRLFDRAIDVVLELGAGAKGHDIVWRVAYQRVAHPKGIDEASAEIEGEVVLGSGALSPSNAEN